MKTFNKYKIITLKIEPPAKAEMSKNIIIINRTKYLLE